MKNLLVLIFSSSIFFGWSFGSDYDQNLRMAVEAIKKSESLQELMRNPNNHDETFRRFSRRPIDKSKLCTSLLKLDREDLALFEQVLETYQSYLKLTCYDELVIAIERFHHLSRTNFINIAGQAKKFNLKGGGDSDWHSSGNLREIRTVGPKQEFLYNGEISVDTQKGAVIYRKDPLTGSTERLNVKKGEIIFSFDDGPHPSRTRSISQILDKHQAKALFFAMGSHAAAHPNVVREVSAKGHIYGSHSQTHKELSKLSLDNAKAEIKNGHLNVVAANDNQDSGFFRFPYGSSTPELITYLKQNLLVSFFWNMDTMDWKYADATKLYNQTVDEINREQKGIILFHDVHQQTVNILDVLLENLREAGYTVKIAAPLK